MIEAVIFDLDGTLVQIPIDYEKMLQEFKKILKIDNLKPIAEKIEKTGEVTKKEIFGLWDRAEIAASKEIKPNKKGLEIYRKFLDKPHALITLQGKKIVHIILENHQLNFDVIITREDSLNRTVQLKKASDQLRIPYPKILFVGNTDGDEAAAARVGCQFIRIE